MTFFRCINIDILNSTHIAQIPLFPLIMCCKYILQCPYLCRDDLYEYPCDATPTPLVFNEGNLNAAGYIANVLESIAVPYLRRLINPILQQDKLMWWYFYGLRGLLICLQSRTFGICSATDWVIYPILRILWMIFGFIFKNLGMRYHRPILIIWSSDWKCSSASKWVHN